MRTIIADIVRVQRQLRAFIRERLATHFFDVHPRYSAGSDAMVDEQTALRVRANEADEYVASLLGLYGEASRQKALDEGLAGVVLAIRETRKGWDTLDLITGERYLRPFQRPQDAS